MSRNNGKYSVIAFALLIAACAGGGDTVPPEETSDAGGRCLDDIEFDSRGTCYVYGDDTWCCEANDDAPPCPFPAYCIRTDPDACVSLVTEESRTTGERRYEYSDGTECCGRCRSEPRCPSTLGTSCECQLEASAPYYRCGTEPHRCVPISSHIPYPTELVACEGCPALTPFSDCGPKH